MTFLDSRYLSPHRSLLGRVLHAPSKWMPPRLILPILSGPAHGMRWIVGSSIHRCWLGLYESERQSTLARLVSRGEVLYDIGANVGIFTLLASRLVSDSGRVVSFEPSPKNCALLRKHVHINQCSNVQIIEAAILDYNGTVTFRSGSGPADHLSEDGDLTVGCLSVDSAIHEGLPPPNHLKIDVEGAESRVLKGAIETLKSAGPTIYLATHGPVPERESVDVLTELGYSCEHLGSGDYLCLHRRKRERM